MLRIADRLIPFAALLLAGCGGSARSHLENGPDGGSRSDAGSEVDADSGTSSDAGSGNSADSGPPGDAGGNAALTGPTVYPFGRRHSPITEPLAAALRAMAAADPDLHGDLFAKVGDSNTASTSFAACFSGPSVDLDGRSDLESALDRFNGGDAGGATPFARVSLAARVGMGAGSVLAGAPAPLDQETAAIAPRFAVVMLGTNDVGASDLFAFTRNLLAVADHLSGEGVVPILFTIPPRNDSGGADGETVDFNAAIHGVAQARQVPLVDLDRELRALAGHGLAVDGFHLDVYVDGGTLGCVLTDAGLAHGQNVHNLLAIEALARASRALDAEPGPDPVSVLPGQGTRAAPFVVDTLPFVDSRNTAVDGESRLDAYPSCDTGAVDESGNEVLYRLAVNSATPVRIRVVSLGAADADLHLLSDPTDRDSCTAGDDRQIDSTLTPGTWWIAVDTTVTAGTPNAGEYLLLVLPG